jgi:hypothetical protein
MIKRVVVFLAVGLVVLAVGARVESGKAGRGVGDVARPFDVTTTDVERVSLDSLHCKRFLSTSSPAGELHAAPSFGCSRISIPITLTWYSSWRWT